MAVRDGIAYQGRARCSWKSLRPDDFQCVLCREMVSEVFPVSSLMVFMHRTMLYGSMSFNPFKLLRSKDASSRAPSDLGEANRDRIRSTRALVQWEQVVGTWLARLKTRTVLRFLQSRQRYSYNGIDYIPMVDRGCRAGSANRRSGTKSVSMVLANVRAKTGPLPAFRRAFAHSFTVVPVVKTSSTRRMRVPARSCGLRTENAFRRFRNRACRDKVVWGSVAAVLTRFVAETGRDR